MKRWVFELGHCRSSWEEMLVSGVGHKFVGEQGLNKFVAQVLEQGQHRTAGAG